MTQYEWVSDEEVMEADGDVMLTTLLCERLVLERNAFRALLYSIDSHGRTPMEQLMHIHQLEEHARIIVTDMQDWG